MRARLLLAVSLCALVALVGCSGENNTPSEPQFGSINWTIVPVNMCEDDFLKSLSPVLAAWHDTLEMYTGAETLNMPPAYADGTLPGDYVALLDPVLMQWRPTIQDSLDVALDSLPALDGVASQYLLDLSPVLAQWHSALEGSLGTDLFAMAPVYVEDTTPPVIVCPADTTLECAGTTLDFVVTAMDNCDPHPMVVSDWESGSAFPAGETLVSITAVDSAGNVAECSFTVTVQDTTPPVIACPADTTLDCTGPDGAVLDFLVTATDNCDSTSTVECDWESGASFPLGETIVTCTSTDASGNTAQCAFTVTVQDTVPPVVTLGASPAMLWPPNHKMKTISLDVETEDCGEVTCEVMGVTSNEPINGTGDGNTEPDWMIVGNTVKLRAERSGGGSGRVYTIHVRCTDPSGNSTDATVDVVVPHDQSGGNGDDD